MEDGSQTMSHQTGDPIPRPNSTSAAEAAVSQLLGMTGLTEGNGTNEAHHDHSPDNASPTRTEPPTQSQPLHATPQYHGATPAATAGGSTNGMMSCQNCSTSITPLWRRDEYGSVLCNACGLFLKLHGRPRPISLKTDVIKSRNRVKTMRPDGSGKKKTSTPSHNNQAARRQSTNAHADGTTDSPISRTGTPSMYNNSLQSFVIDDPYASAGVPGYGTNGASGDGSGSPMNGDTPQTHEQLIANNSSLKTRVRELELINELFRGRLSQLEQQEAAARRGHEVAGVEQTQLRNQLEASQDAENQLRAQLEDSHRRENSLKRRLDELELELMEAKEALEAGSDRPAKKARVGSPEQSTKQEPTSQPDEQAEKGPDETHPEPDMAVDAES